MKINTDGCKKALYARYGSVNWKRISKRKVDNTVVREFTNGAYNAKVTTSNDDSVILDIERLGEQDTGDICPCKKLPAGKYYFAMCNCDYNDNCFNVMIEPAKHWKEEGCLADTYEDEESEEIEAACKEVGLLGDMESTYSFKQKITKTEARKLLLDIGFCENQEFTKFITEDEPPERECRQAVANEHKEDEERKLREETRKLERNPDEVYVDEHISEAIAKLKKLPEFNVYWLVSKYMKGYQKPLLVSTVKLHGGKEIVLSSEYLRAYLVNERGYELVKEIMDIPI